MLCLVLALKKETFQNIWQVDSYASMTGLVMQFIYDINYTNFIQRHVSLQPSHI